jgi:uncharacterized protein YggU (UPF0235/DUF167 family)
VLQWPKSDIAIIRGLKSRDKIVAITGVDVTEGLIEKVRGLLLSAVVAGGGGITPHS